MALFVVSNCHVIPHVKAITRHVPESGHISSSSVFNVYIYIFSTNFHLPIIGEEVQFAEHILQG